MHGLLDRLRIGREQPRSDPLEAAQARIGELTEVLQGLVNLSDSSRSRDFAEVKRLLARARKILSDPSHGTQMLGGEEPAYYGNAHRLRFQGGQESRTGGLPVSVENGMKLG